MRYMEDFAERELADAISDRLDEMADQLVENCMESLEERLNGIEQRMLERMTNHIEQRLIGSRTARFPRNETRQGRNALDGRRNDENINEEAHNHQNSDDEDVGSVEEEPLYMPFLCGDDVEVNDGLNQAEKPRNEARQVRNALGGRRNDVIINEEAENHQNLDDEDVSSSE